MGMKADIMDFLDTIDTPNLSETAREELVCRVRVHYR